jgi:hypothetical protein
MPLTAAQVKEEFFDCAADTVERPSATQNLSLHEPV